MAKLGRYYYYDYYYDKRNKWDSGKQLTQHYQELNYNSKRANSYLGKTGLLDTAGIAGPADIEEVERLNE